MPGPPPKRSAERRRRNDTGPVEEIEVEGEVRVPRLPRGTHPTARRWYRSLRQSGQSHLYEPSDWAFAVYIAGLVDKACRQDEPSAALAETIQRGMRSLLTTEAERRRLRIEITRSSRANRTGAGVKDIRDYQREFEEGES